MFVGVRHGRTQPLGAMGALCLTQATFSEQGSGGIQPHRHLLHHSHHNGLDEEDEAENGHRAADVADADVEADV